MITETNAVQFRQNLARCSARSSSGTTASSSRRTAGRCGLGRRPAVRADSPHAGPFDALCERIERVCRRPEATGRRRSTRPSHRSAPAPVPTQAPADPRGDAARRAGHERPAVRHRVSGQRAGGSSRRGGTARSRCCSRIHLDELRRVLPRLAQRHGLTDAEVATSSTHSRSRRRSSSARHGRPRSARRATSPSSVVARRPSDVGRRLSDHRRQGSARPGGPLRHPRSGRVLGAHAGCDAHGPQRIDRGLVAKIGAWRPNRAGMPLPTRARAILLVGAHSGAMQEDRAKAAPTTPRLALSSRRSAFRRDSREARPRADSNRGRNAAPTEPRRIHRGMDAAPPRTTAASSRDRILRYSPLCE